MKIKEKMMVSIADRIIQNRKEKSSQEAKDLREALGSGFFTNLPSRVHCGSDTYCLSYGKGEFFVREICCRSIPYCKGDDKECMDCWAKIFNSKLAKTVSEYQKRISEGKSCTMPDNVIVSREITKFHPEGKKKEYASVFDEDSKQNHIVEVSNISKSPLEPPPCSDILTCSQELADLHSQPSKSAKSKQRNSLKSIQMHKQYCDLTIQVFPSIVTSETSIPKENSSISLPQDSHAQTHQSQEIEQELQENIVRCGSKDCELSENVSQLSLSLKIQQGYSIEAWEQSLAAYPKAGTMQNGRLSQQRHLECLIKEKECLSLPTLNASAGTSQSNATGQTKCERWFRENGLLANSQCLSPQMMASLQGFPQNWTKCLWESAEVLGDELEADTYLVEQLGLDVQPLHLEELSISTPASSESEKLPLEPKKSGLIKSLINNSDQEWTEQYDRIAKLERERDQIRASGAIAVSGVWIECGKVSGKEFRQAYFRSTVPIFQAKSQAGFAKSESGLVKRQYIGEENSKAVTAAAESIVRRNRLIAIAKEIEMIERKLEEVPP